MGQVDFREVCGSWKYSYLKSKTIMQHEKGEKTTDDTVIALTNLLISSILTFRKTEYLTLEL